MSHFISWKEISVVEKNCREKLQRVVANIKYEKKSPSQSLKNQKKGTFLKYLDRRWICVKIVHFVLKASNLAKS